MANLTTGLLSGAGIAKQIDDINKLSGNVESGISNLSDAAVSGTTFQPFTITTGTGTSSVGPGGGFNTALTPELQALQNGLFSGAGNFFNQAQQDTGDREADIYELIRATQRPDERRAQLGLAGREVARGRSGIRSGMFGGTPEQLSMQKAIAEARNQAALMAIQQGQAEQLQQANIGSNFLKSGFMPEAQNLNNLQVGTNLANLSQTGQIAGTNLASQLGLGGLQTQTNLEKLKSDLIAQLFGTAGGLFTSNNSDPLSDILGAIGGLFSEGTA